jgi:hypothetical protein
MWAKSSAAQHVTKLHTVLLTGLRPQRFRVAVCKSPGFIGNPPMSCSVSASSRSRHRRTRGRSAGIRCRLPGVVLGRAEQPHTMSAVPSFRGRPADGSVGRDRFDGCCRPGTPKRVGDICKPTNSAETAIPQRCQLQEIASPGQPPGRVDLGSRLWSDQGRNAVGAEARWAQYSPLITKYEPRIVPASFDFCRANLNEPSSAGTSIPSESLNPTARFFGSSSEYATLIESPFS